MRLFLYLITILIVTTPLSALADDGEHERTQLSLRFGTDVLIAGNSPQHVGRWAGYIGLGYRPPDMPFYTYIDTHLGWSFLKFDDELTDGLGIDVRLSQAANLSIEAGMLLDVYQSGENRSGPMLIQLYFAIQTTVLKDEMHITHGYLRTEQGEFDVTPFLREHSSTQYKWNSISGGVTMRYRFGSVEPRISLGIERLFMLMDLQLDDDGKEVATSLDEDYAAIERTYELAYIAATLTPGLDIHLSDNLKIVADVLFMPVPESVILGSSVGLEYAF